MTWFQGLQGACRLERRPHGAHTVSPPYPENRSSDGRMKVEMLVGVDVVERKPGGLISPELRLDFGRELFAMPGTEEEADAGLRHVVVKPAAGIHQIGNPLRRQNRAAIHQDEMQADTKSWQLLGPGDGIAGGRRPDHQAGRRQNAVPVCLLDGEIDFRRSAEIVGGDDQRLQLAILRRSFRNWKNSTPSRSRRFIIWGLFTISPTIEAILPERK